MRSNKMKIGLVLLLSLLTINTASANPGFNVDVETTSSTVGPGGTVTYAVTLTAMDSLTVDEFADLSVIDSAGNPVSWTTEFGDNLFLIGPGSPEKTVTLEVTVPEGTPAGEYQMKVLGEGYLPDLYDPTIPDEFLGSIESSDFPITVTVTQIPEFPTIAVPVISALGIVFLASRRKEGNS
ncbi:hypothetical protein MSSIT_1717 [Methanosarcina siciliae T4/M]|uniref:PEF-CTERM protein sorting domain-containing protein n=1 Tax=Methanosarcina siciliae T4/M TaxID=1434120 RepID=A0A0E3L8F6_9EURY|nr:hypothetical protein [Methanosarcina siciliae]AKB28436.1 hypothetical protein MSSIT_1717 [Methanosarcina siciliae T4/M]